MTDRMGAIARRVRDGARFGRGALAARSSPTCDELRRWGQPDGIRVLSVDVFETLLTRSLGAEEAVRRESAKEARRLSGIAERGGPGDDEVAALRARVEGQLRREARSRGEDPEVRLADVNDRLLRELGQGAAAPAAVAELCRYELSGELLRTSPNMEVVEWMARARQLGLRVIAVTDMHFGAVEVGWLLAQHGVPALDRIYVSSDVGLGKFSGRLFCHVLEKERVDPGEVLHVGDRLLNDVLAPRALGLRAVWYRRTAAASGSGAPAPGPAERPRATPEPPRGERGPVATDEAARVFGEEVLGPVLTTFARLLLLRANRLRIDRLLFVARDGDLLQRVVEVVQGASPPALRIPSRYVYLSRRATNVPGLERLGRTTIEEIFAASTAHRTMGAAWSSLNLDAAAFGPWLSVHGCDDPDRPLEGGAANDRLARLLADEGFQMAFAEEARRQRRLLESYLRQEGFFDGKQIALVDVGWRGSTQTSLQLAFGRQPGFRALHGFYVGLWPPDSLPMLPDLDRKEGVLADCRNGRSVLEGAAHYLSLLLEAVCRADHGTVLGYSEDGRGTVQPVLASEEGERMAEQNAGHAARAIAEGVLARARAEAAWPGANGRPNEERRAAQKALLRLAFFPNDAEIRVGRTLVHTDRFSDAWHISLMPAEPANLLRHPGRWVRQLQSPWRAGVVAQTGGWPLSALHLLLETGLTALPRGFRIAFQRTLLSAAGITSGRRP